MSRPPTWVEAEHQQSEVTLVLPVDVEDLVNGMAELLRTTLGPPVVALASVGKSLGFVATMIR